MPASNYSRLIDALSEAVRRGGEAMPVRQSYNVGTAASPGRLLTMPAWERGKALGVKLVTVFPKSGECGLPAFSSCCSTATGRPRAMIDGETHTNRPTAAASALASRHLSRPDSRMLLLIVTGRLASYLAVAHRAVRPIEAVLVWGRNAQRVQALADTLEHQGLKVKPAADLTDALSVADIVSCATTSREPLIVGQHLRPGTHLDLVDAFTPEMRETDDDAVCRSRVFVDAMRVPSKKPVICSSRLRLAGGTPH